jgi:1,4-dihydroxy-2-naphthoate polyprenyltransferase
MGVAHHVRLAVMNPELPTGMKRWWLGSRPRTLPAAVVPVAVGAACAVGDDTAAMARALLALVVSLALQVGVNYANDYSDGVRGTDDVRVGPLRLVASGVASPGAVKRAALMAFGVAGLAGLWLASMTSWWLLVVGAAALVAGWTYTGGPKPYGYLGLGEVFVFVFFGLVATAGTTYVILDRWTGWPVVAAIPVGCWACALLVVNNLRDRPTDAAVGKNTLAVRLGDRPTRWLYAGLLTAALVMAVVVAVMWRWPAVIVVLGAPLAWKAWSRVRAGAMGKALIPVLELTGRVQLVAGGAFAVGLALGGWIN